MTFEGDLTVAKVLCVLYDDPVDGYPKTYPRASVPALEKYPNGQSMPTPEAIDFTPGELLGIIAITGLSCCHSSIRLPQSENYTLVRAFICQYQQPFEPLLLLGCCHHIVTKKLD